jgi:hypothetical protein
MSNKPRVFPSAYTLKWRYWSVLSGLWIFLHYSLGILGIVAAALLPLFDEHKEGQAILSVLAVICTSLVTFLSARKNANIFLHAWRATEIVRLKYMHDSSITDLHVQKVIEEQELYIQKYETEA